MASHPGSSGASPPRFCKSRSEPGQAGGPTGRQSAAAPVRVGSPAESKTASWCAARRCAASVRGRGPPGEAALGEPLVAEPEPLAVVHEDFQRRRLAIAEDEDRSDERVVLQGFLAEPRQAIDPRRKSAGSTATRIFICGVIWSITGRSRSCATAPRRRPRRSRPVARAWWPRRRCRARADTACRPGPVAVNSTNAGPLDCGWGGGCPGSLLASCNSRGRAPWRCG